MDYNKKSAKEKQTQNLFGWSAMKPLLLKRAIDRGVPLRWIAAFCTSFMLCILPLAFRDGFFDINRWKVHLVLGVVPSCALLVVIFGYLWYKAGGNLKIHDELKPLLASVLVFLLCCLVSSFIQGFSAETLWGSDGRYCGLYFISCCCAVFFIAVIGSVDGNRIAVPGIAAAMLVATLGIMNGCGMDPLGFYERLKPSQIPIFISTIGNVDFFGAYLAVLFPLSGAKAAFSDAKGKCLVYGIASAVIVLGIAVSRSDSAYCALQISFLILSSLCGDQLRALLKINLLWSFSFLALPLAGFMLKTGKWEIPFSGILGVICDTGAAWVMMSVFLLAAYCCCCAVKRGRSAPGRDVLLRRCAWVIAWICILLLLSILYFTFINPHAEIGEAAMLLRFDDRWGTRRGFVYRCSIEALSDYTMMQWLFGKGVDCTKQILMPYFDDADMLKYGVFNDAHCQPLQFLLTTGIAGVLSYLTVYLLVMRTCLRYAEGNPMLCGCFASLCGYAVIALLSAAQPIIVMTFFSVAALVALHVHHLKRRESHES